MEEGKHGTNFSMVMSSHKEVFEMVAVLCWHDGEPRRLIDSEDVAVLEEDIQGYPVRSKLTDMQRLVH